MLKNNQLLERSCKFTVGSVLRRGPRSTDDSDSGAAAVAAAAYAGGGPPVDVAAVRAGASDGGGRTHATGGAVCGGEALHGRVVPSDWG